MSASVPRESSLKQTNKQTPQMLVFWLKFSQDTLLSLMLKDLV